jgi:phage gpG-like protein
MNLEQLAQQIERQAAEIQTLFNGSLPIKAGEKAIEHFHENFLQGGFVNNGLQAWQPAKRLSNPRNRNNNKTLLSSRNHLFSSIKKQTAPGQVTITSDVEYAAVHNEGLKAGRGAGFTMPKRQFIGESAELNDKVKELIDTEMGRILHL